MSALAVGDADGVPPLERPPAVADPTVAVDGDVVLSGVVLILVALAFAFVMHRFLAAVRGRCGGPAARTSSSASSGGGVDDDAAAKVAGGGGVDPAVLRALPVTVYRRAEEAAAALECAVCIAEVEDGEAARFLPGCGHGFHAECVDLWLRSRSTCPLCRVAVVADDDAAPPFAFPLPPVQPEPANYYAAATTTALLTNVLFWGTHGGAVTTTTTTSVAEYGGGGHGNTDAAASPSSSLSGGGDAAGAAVIIDVADTATTATAPAKAQGGRERLVGSLRRMWSRGANSSSCT